MASFFFFGFVASSKMGAAKAYEIILFKSLNSLLNLMVDFSLLFILKILSHNDIHEDAHYF